MNTRRLVGALQRRIIVASRLDLLRKRRLQRQRAAYRAHDAAAEPLRSLIERGVWVGAPQSALLPSGDVATLKAAAHAFPGGAQLDGEALWQSFPKVYELGLSPGLLDLAEDYLGLSCLYLGATLKAELPDGRSGGTRQWHLDIEDDRMLRVLVYANDVEAGGGPFEYAGAEPSAAIRAAGYRSGYLDDGAMAAHSPRSEWTPVYGAAGTVIAFDGARLFHRAQPPCDRPRLSVTFAYTSRGPLELRRSSRLTARSRRQLAVDRRALECVPPARLF